MSETGDYLLEVLRRARFYSVEESLSLDQHVHATHRAVLLELLEPRGFPN